jgi:uncharacterized protein Smg (DUF494 family)
MQQKVLEIIEFLISAIEKKQDPKVADLDLLSKKLIERGYNERDIQTAVEWIFNILDRSSDAPTLGNFEIDDWSIRILSPFERKIFSSEAYGYLLQLQLLGLISPLQVDQLIDRCLMMGLDMIGLEEVKTISTHILVGRDVGGQNSKPIYHPGNDKIN